MRLFLIIVFSVLSSVALAQQQQAVDPMWQQQLLNTLQAQRNKSLDETAVAQAQLSVAQSVVGELQKKNYELQKQIDDLKAKYEPSKKEEPKVEPPKEEEKKQP